MLVRMDASYSPYSYTKSIERIDEVLKGADTSYTQKDSIPPRDSLTFDNGFYVHCSALFIDIRGSKKLAEKHTRPVQAKIYKTFISELVAVLKGHSKINEIYIEGDCVWGYLTHRQRILSMKLLPAVSLPHHS